VISAQRMPRYAFVLEMGGVPSAPPTQWMCMGRECCQSIAFPVSRRTLRGSVQISKQCFSVTFHISEEMTVQGGC
jgi:hypothetical protein